MSPDTPDFLTAHARANPARPALIEHRPGEAPVTLSYDESNRAANRLANALLEMGTATGEKVVWCGPNSIGTVTMMHAARKIGATAVPLNYRFTPDEAAYVIDNCDAAVVYVDAEFAGLVEAAGKHTPKVRHTLVFGGEPQAGMHSADALMAAASDDEPARPASDKPAMTMIYTSGTTGHPKGAVRESAVNPTQAQAMLALIGYRPDDVYLTTGPIYHSGPGGFMGVAMMLGNTVVLQRKFDPEDWLRLVESYGVSSTFSAPTPIRMVCNLADEVKSRYDVSSMRIMIANAAPWSFALKQAYVADFPPESLWEVYGSTELGVDTILAPADQLRKPGSCGLPAPGVELKLVDDDGNEVAEAHAPGELFVRSPSVFSTYYKAQDKYDEDRRGDWHTVGDVAYFDDEGYFYICDRKKDMIISGGMNIYPAEIESALEQHDDVYDAAVFGIPSEEWGESVHAVVVARAGAELGEDDVIAHARAHLAGYKIPRSVSFVDELPRTGSGKILKRVLREPFWRDHESRVH